MGGAHSRHPENLNLDVGENRSAHLERLTLYHPIIGPPVVLADPRSYTSNGNEATKILRDELQSQCGREKRARQERQTECRTISAFGERGREVNETLTLDSEATALFLKSQAFRNLIERNVSQKSSRELKRGGFSSPARALENSSDANSVLEVAQGATLENEDWDDFYGPPVRKHRYSSPSSSPSDVPKVGFASAVAKVLTANMAKDRFLWQKAARAGAGDFSSQRFSSNRSETLHPGEGASEASPRGFLSQRLTVSAPRNEVSVQRSTALVSEASSFRNTGVVQHSGLAEDVRVLNEVSNGRGVTANEVRREGEHEETLPGLVSTSPSRAQHNIDESERCAPQFSSPNTPNDGD